MENDRRNESSDENNKGLSLPNSFTGIREAGPFIGLGIQLAAAVVLMFFVGRWFDQKWGTAPWLMVVGLLIGTAAGLYNFIRTVTAIDQKKNQAKSKNAP